MEFQEIYLLCFISIDFPVYYQMYICTLVCLIFPYKGPQIKNRMNETYVTRGNVCFSAYKS